MLPERLKPIGFDTQAKEEWGVYRVRLNLPSDEGVLQFYRQVVFDHFEYFNEHYPDICIDDYSISIEIYSAHEAHELIRYFRNELMEFWAEQFDEFKRRNYDYMIYQEMSKNRTPPFPPVLIDSSQLKDREWLVYGRPLHLVEGTHRVSYLRQMLRRGLVASDSKHRFVVLRPRSISP